MEEDCSKRKLKPTCTSFFKALFLTLYQACMNLTAANFAVINRWSHCLSQAEIEIEILWKLLAHIFHHYCRRMLFYDVLILERNPADLWTCLQVSTSWRTSFSMLHFQAEQQTSASDTLHRSSLMSGTRKFTTRSTARFWRCWKCISYREMSPSTWCVSS